MAIGCSMTTSFTLTVVSSVGVGEKKELNETGSLEPRQSTSSFVSFVSAGEYRHYSLRKQSPYRRWLHEIVYSNEGMTYPRPTMEVGVGLSRGEHFHRMTRVLTFLLSLMLSAILSRPCPGTKSLMQRLPRHIRRRSVACGLFCWILIALIPFFPFLIEYDVFILPAAARPSVADGFEFAARFSKRRAAGLALVCWSARQ